jgi:hypothetical protein
MRSNCGASREPSTQTDEEFEKSIAAIRQTRDRDIRIKAKVEAAKRESQAKWLGKE